MLSTVRLILRLWLMTQLGTMMLGTTLGVELPNPIFPGFFADPSIVQHQGKFYLYATKDPWGGDDLACFSTSDFENWQSHTLSWPTRAACQSRTGNDNKIWAPSVVKAPDGRFVMYVSVGSEIYCGTAPTPTGPWQNLHADGTPLVRDARSQGIHSIDGECFVDDDGQAYLYWGSGWDWKDGHCLAAKLNPDMSSFADEPREITPPNYFEAPFMLNRNGHYYLMYSHGKTIDDTYQVHYAVGDSPLGPFSTEGKNSPILTSDKDKRILGPGHHCVFKLGDNYYIAYHRHSRPFDSSALKRQICFDRLEFDDAGNIKKVIPTDQGIDLVMP